MENNKTPKTQLSWWERLNQTPHYLYIGIILAWIVVIILFVRNQTLTSQNNDLKEENKILYSQTITGYLESIRGEARQWEGKVQAIDVRVQDLTGQKEEAQQKLDTLYDQSNQATILMQTMGTENP